MPTETREEERRLTVTPYEKYDLGSFTSPLPPVILADLFRLAYSLFSNTLVNR